MNDFSIYSGRIVIRNIRETDTEAIFQYRSLPEVAKYQYWEPFTKEQVIDFVKRCSHPDFEKEGQWIGLAIEHENKVIGDCAFCIANNTVEIGCNISPQYQNKGFAKEALSFLIDYCFNKMKVREITGITDSKNDASIKLMELLGMIKVPGFENNIICKGEDCIEHKYSLLRNKT